MNLFFDSSALAKRYLKETGSNCVAKLLEKADEMAVSILCPVEIMATFRRLYREKRLTNDQYHRLKTLFFEDLEDILVVNLEPRTIKHAILTIESSPLKTLDALHLACALDWIPDYFISSDKQQITAARKIGLTVVDLH